jgi:hypothetical protein
MRKHMTMFYYLFYKVYNLQFLFTKRILFGLSVLTVCTYLFVSILTNNAAGQSCTNIAGDWIASETVVVTCTSGGQSETVTQSGTVTITIFQNGCNVNYNISTQFGTFSRTGTVSGNGVDFSGVFLSAQPGCSFNQNNITINGTINGNTITFSGSGVATGTCGGQSGSCTGTSTATFSRIGSPPSVTVTSPNGGENWQMGTTQNITWTGNPGTNVKLEYTTNGGSSWNNIISSTANDGSYSWTVPNTPTTSARVRVTSTTDSFYSDTSDSNFTINQSTIVWVDFTYTGTESGTQSQPFNTLAEAINAVAVGGEIIIKGGVTSETFTGLNKIDKKVTIKSSGGTATIGKQ